MKNLVRFGAVLLALTGAAACATAQGTTTASNDNGVNRAISSTTSNDDANTQGTAHFNSAKYPGAGVARTR